MSELLQESSSNALISHPIPTEYHSKSLKSRALYLAQGIMGGINVHRHNLVFIILGRERDVHLLHSWWESESEEDRV